MCPVAINERVGLTKIIATLRMIIVSNMFQFVTYQDWKLQHNMLYNGD